jgi:hypothetical protein
MKRTAPSKLLYTCTVLLFFLSVAVLDLQASEAGREPVFGSKLVNWRLPNRTFVIQRARPRVAGISIAAAKVMIDDTDVVYAPVQLADATTTPPTATTTPPITATTTPKNTGLDRAIERIDDHLADRPDNKGLLNARERLIANQERKAGGSTTTPTTSQPLISLRQLGDLRSRILKLEYKLSELEEQVIQREKQLIKRVNTALVRRLLGKILLSVEKNGEAYYLSPETGSRLYLKDGNSAFQILRSFGTGATTDDLDKIPVGVDTGITETDTNGDGLSDKLEESLGTDPANSDTDGDGNLDGTEVRNGYAPKGLGKMKLDAALAKRLEGKFMLQVAGNGAHGQAWYIKDGKRYYMKDGDTAYEMMKHLSVGITNEDIEQIPVESINLEESTEALETSGQ